MTLSVNWNNKLWINTLFSGFILILLIILAFPLHAQQIKILPLGNSITYDTIVTDARPMGIKTSYRYRLYNLLSSNGYNFDFIGSESTGADSLPAGFADHAGFPGITTSQLLTLLQTGRNYVVDPVNGFCELPFCNQNYLTYYKPDVILLHIGTNDLSLGTAEATVITSLINILNEIDAYEASVGNTVPVILCQIINRMGPLASGNHLATSNYNDLMATMVASRPADEIILVNMEDNAGIDYRPVADGGDMVDTWHPAYSGYYKMGQLFYNQINTYDFTPVLDNATISINENLPNGTTVNTLSGRDFDPGTSLTYSKISGSTAFDVATNGAITVANSAALDYETTPQFTISVRVSDGAKTDDATITINLNNVNEAPALSNPGATVSFTEGNSPVQLTSTITVSDIDNTQLQGATIQITGNFQSGEDVLSFTSANGITGSYSSGTLTLSGTAALANYQTALRSVTYSNTSENPNTSARTVTFTVNDGVLPSNSVSKNITVLGTNDAPVLANIETGTISYTEGDGQVQVTNSITITDVDDTYLESATISITTNRVNAEDRLSYTSSGGVTGSYNSTSGVLAISGHATLANYLSVLKSVQYENINTVNPTASTRTLTFTINDGDVSSNTVSRNVTVSGDNSAPVLANIETGTISYTEGDGQVQVTNSITITDVDDTYLESATISITTNRVNAEDRLSYTSSGGVTGSYNSTSGVLAISGHATLANYLSVLKSVLYENINTINPTASTRTVTFVVNDGDVSSNTVSRNVTVSGNNSAPVLANIETGAISFTEGDGQVQVTNTITVNDVDDTSLESAQVVITTGRDATEDSLLFTNTAQITGTFSPATGILNLTGTTTLANYRTALRSVFYKNTDTLAPSTATRTIQFIVFDGDDNSNMVSRNISVTGVNDPPVATNVIITGTRVIPSTLVASFSYSDPEGNPIGTHQYQWFRSTTNTGWGVPISGATATSYILDYPDGGNYICVRVRPADNLGAVGDSIRSPWYAIDAAPVASNPVIRGIIAINQRDTASFAYSDQEGALPGAHLYRWFRATNNLGAGETPLTTFTSNSTFDITSALNGSYISFKVIPKALSGSLTGDTVQSSWYGPISELPTAAMSGTDTVCVGDTAIITVALTGAKPWTIKYTRNGANETTISNINVNNNQYTFKVTTPGVYALTSVSDAQYPTTTGIVSGQAIITNFVLPSVILTGGGQICNDGLTTAPLNFAMTGKFPWTLTYTRNNGVNPAVDTTVIAAASPFVKNELRNATYSVKSLVDGNGCKANTTGSGTVTISYKNSPTAVISGLDTICQGDPATLFVNFTGSGPWTIEYTVNGLNPKIRNIPANQNPYTLADTLVGTYALTSVFDQTWACTGKVSGTGRVASYSFTSAVLSGDTTICEYTTGKLRVDFQGSAPWNFSYKRVFDGGEDIIQRTGITANPYFINVTKPGEYTLINLEDEYCPGVISGSATVDTLKAPEVDIVGLGSIYSQFSDKDTFNIVVNPAGGSGSFDILNQSYILDPPGDDIYFYPAFAGYANSPHWIKYTYNSPVNVCQRKDSVQVFVLENIAAIQFDNPAYNKDIYCFNDDTIKVFGFTIEGTPDSLRLSGTGGFISVNDSTGLIIPTEIQSGTRKLTFYYTSTNQESIERTFSFEKITGNFRWDNECFTDEATVEFTQLSQGDNSLVHHQWNITLPDTVISLEASPAEYVFDELGSYPLEYITTSEFGCTDTVRKTLILKPTARVHEENYFEDFSDGTSYWIPQSNNPSEFYSWSLGTPDGETFNAAPGEKAWYTNITNLQQAEYSYVSSPCFDFSESQRPMIKMNVWRAFTPGLDGSVLQYTTDNGLTWNDVGDVGDGINWFNSYNINNFPFNNGIGWTNIKDTQWKESRHTLDNLVGEPRVRFRIAYGAQGINFERDGMAFDNFWIGERGKRVLLEHFTNTADVESPAANEIVNQLTESSSSDVLNIQYHTSFPGQDPFNSHNSVDPNARSGYYGISDVPYAILDGGTSSATRFNFENENIPTSLSLNLISLSDLEFNIELFSENSGSAIDINASIIPLDTVLNKEITLHIAVIEHEITGVETQSGEAVFKNVLKAMLPNAAGTNYFRDWYPNNKETVNYNWQFSDVFDPDQIRVIAFIQDESSKEIYQVVIDSDVISSSNPAELNSKEFKYKVFPNPSYGEVNIVFNQDITGGNKTVRIYDPIGTLVYQDEIYNAEDLVHLQLDFLRNGIYLIHITQGQKILLSEKLILLK